MSENKTDQTVQHKATDLKPVESTSPKVEDSKSTSQGVSHSVLIDDSVYKVEAKNVSEAADKANKIHKNKKGTK